MKGIFLDAMTVDYLNMDLSVINSVLSDFQVNNATNLDAVLAQITGKQVVISNKVVLNRDILTSSSDLQLVCVAATGMNNIDLQAAIDNNIVVCNVERYASESVTQHVFGLIISLLRNFPAYKKAVQQAKWHNSPSFTLLNYNIENLSDKTLGIIGYGELGRAVEKLAQCFGMKVIIAERKAIKKTQLRAGRVPFDKLLQQSDVISVHCPLTEKTHNLLSSAQFSQMKKNCILINTARGGIVDEAALLEALQNGTIAAAGIDVLEVEPPLAQSPLLQQGAMAMDNLIVTPHIAWASQQSRQMLLNKIAQNISCFKNDEYRNLSNFYF